MSLINNHLLPKKKIAFREECVEVVGAKRTAISS